jgi:hypothetical protein
MWIDNTLEFADAVSVGTPNLTTVNIGDVIDTGSIVRALGQGTPLYCVVGITTSITGASSFTSFQVASDAGATLGLDETQTLHGTTPTHPVATWVAGFTEVFALNAAAGERYMGFQAREHSNNALSAGNVNAFLTLDNHGWTSYPDAING